jgi:hypothetical protein
VCDAVFGALVRYGQGRQTVKANAARPQAAFAGGYKHAQLQECAKKTKVIMITGGSEDRIGGMIDRRQDAPPSS